MTEVLSKCSICQAYIDEEDLFCGNCGAEAPLRKAADAGATKEARLEKHSFECKGCGASMSYDADARNLRCPFCGSERMENEKPHRSLAARFVVPFQVNADDASEILTRWMGNGFFRPSDLVEAARVEKMTAVYVPYWAFQATTKTYWTGDSSDTPVHARGDWFPVSGETSSTYSGLLIGASSALTPAETRELCPYDLGRQTPADSYDTTGFVVEQFKVPRKYARPLARQGLEELERKKCAGFISGRSRNVKVNVRLEGLRSEPVLIPVWMIAFRYRQKLFRFLINGQNGRAYGKAPFSYLKLLMVIGIILAVLLVIAGVAAVINAM